MYVNEPFALTETVPCDGWVTEPPLTVIGCALGSLSFTRTPGASTVSGTSSVAAYASVEPIGATFVQKSVIKGATGLFAGQQLATYDQTIYSSVQSAPSFQYSWDQAVPPQEATPMLANLAQVFELTMTPQKFAATMDSQNSGA